MKEHVQTTPNQNKATLTAAIESKLGRMNNQGVSWERLTTMKQVYTVHVKVGRGWLAIYHGINRMDATETAFLRLLDGEQVQVQVNAG